MSQVVPGVVGEAVGCNLEVEGFKVTLGGTTFVGPKNFTFTPNAGGVLAGSKMSLVDFENDDLYWDGATSLYLRLSVPSSAVGDSKPVLYVDNFNYTLGDD